MNKKFTFGKSIICLCLVFFVASIIFATVVPMSSEVAMAIIAGGSTLAITSVVAYLKKAQAENLIKINVYMYKELTKNRLHYIEGVLKLRKKYDVDEETINQIDEEGDADDFVQASLNRSISDADAFVDDSHSIIERQSAE